MSSEQTHNLYRFMRQLSETMASNYQEIHEQSTEDPGTAGDEGEENWANLLRGWLPRTYEVVTKGRIISADGRKSRQVDVVVLKSIYPKQLIDEKHKLYLAAGVAAAFECKTTLKSAHIAEAVQTCVEIKNLYPVREGSPYKELHAPIAYGLLAHSHSWKGLNSTPEENILQNLRGSDRLFVPHPRLSLDILCVADLGAWILMKVPFVDIQRVIESDPPPERRPQADALSGYCEHTPFRENRRRGFTPIGALITNLTELLAWEDPTLRDIASYYRATKMGGGGGAKLRGWPISIYNDGVLSQIKSGRQLISAGASWDEWKAVFGAWPS